MEILLRSGRLDRFFLPLSFVHRDRAGFRAHIETHAAAGTALAGVYYPLITQFVECTVRVGNQASRSASFNAALAGFAQVRYDFNTRHIVVRHGTSIVRRCENTLEPALIQLLRREFCAAYLTIQYKHFRYEIPTGHGYPEC